MELTKAIEILTLILSDEAAVWDPDSRDAIKLATEGLIYINRLRACSIQHRQAHLPGETSIIDPTRSEHAIKKIQLQREVSK